MGRYCKRVEGREQSFVFYKGLAQWFLSGVPRPASASSGNVLEMQILGPTPDPLKQTLCGRGQVIWFNGGGGLSIIEPTLWMRKTEAQRSKFTH